MLIPKRVFPIVALAAKESSGCAIDGVRVERTDDGECRALTTDGRRVAIAKWSDVAESASFDPGDGVVIAAKQWEEADRVVASANSCHLDEVEVAKSKIIRMAMTCDKQVHSISRPVDDTGFPSIDNVVPDYTVGKNAVEIGVDARLLAECCKVIAEVATGAGHKGVRLVVPMDATKPLVLESRNSHGKVSCKIVLMPYDIGI